MIHRVAQQVVQRPGHFFQHRLVEFHAFALDHQVQQLVAPLGRDSHRAVEARRQAPHRQHAQSHQPVFYLPRQRSLTCQVVVEIPDQIVQPRTCRVDVARRFRQIASQYVEFRIPVEFQRVPIFAAAARTKAAA